MSIYPVQTIDRYWLLTLLAGAMLFALSLLLPSRIFALENPSRYYDWNTYYAPSDQVLGTQAFAQEATPTAQTSPTTPTAPDYHDYKDYDGYVLGFTADLNPDDPLYFLKTAQENVALTFTFDPKVREETRLEIAGERLAEIETMTDEGKGAIVASLAATYNTTMETVATNLETLKDQGQDITPVLVTTDLEASKHNLVLEEVSLQVPPEAEQGIKTALAACEKAVDTVADLAGRPAVPPEMVTRLQALKAQGLLTEEEVTKLVNVDSRVAAREEFRKLADANVLPQADFKKLDEAARSYFPQGYNTVLEYKKFQELKKLETQKPDDATLSRLQTFADAYKPGDIVPPDLRTWWVPMIRLEELQNTIRPDLISEDFFRYRPDDHQKYREVVERVKPRAEDITYVNSLIARNPAVLNDPAYARIKAMADRFGSSEGPAPTATAAQSCSRDSHWVSVPFMPNGGYCVPNLVYDVKAFTTQTGAPATCPPGYHRNDPLGPCLPDNPYGPGGGATGGGFIPAPGTCFSGYHWTPLPQSGGYCAPDTPTPGGGPYPGPITPPSYCPAGQIFRDGKCQTYSPPPAEGCPANQYWSGARCIEVKQCPSGQYQNASGDCVTSTGGGGGATCQPPGAGCGFGAHWDSFTCTCQSDTVPVFYSSPGICTPPAAGCGSGVWDSGSCSCRPSGYQTPTGTYASPYGGGDHSCGPGYSWNGSYCVPSTGGTYGTPSGTYTTPPYYTPGSYQYPTPYGGTYSYPTPYGGSYSYPTPSGGTYGTPSYPTPSYYGTPSGSYGTPPPYGTPSYGTPSGSYGTPPPYGTPEYSSPPPYGTPEYSTPPPYGTPSYGTPSGSYGTP